MNSKQKDEKLITPKKFYLQQEVYEQIINGFQSAKEREISDQKKMGVVLRVQQIYRLKISSPFIFGGFFGAEWFKSIFYDQYKKQKQKKINSIRKAFFYSWYDLDWWSKKLKDEQQQFDTQKDKDNWFVKFYKAYRHISRLSRWYKAIKTFKQSCDNCPALQALLGQSYNLMNQRDYRRFQANLNWTVQSAEELFKDAIVVFMKPTVLQIAALYMKKLQQLYDKFCWYVVKSILWGTTWWEVAISIIGYAASIFTFGTSAAASLAAKAAIVGARLVSIFSKFAKLGRGLIKSSSFVLRNVGRVAVGTGRLAGKASGALLRGGQRMGAWGSRVGRNALRGEYRRAAQAYMRRNPKKLKFSKMVIQGGVGLALFYYTLTDYQMIWRQIKKRTHIMYMDTLPLIQNLKNTGEMIGDIGSFLGKVGQGIWETYMSYTQQQKQGDYRTNRKYGLSLKINKTDFENNTMFKALRLFYQRYNFYKDILASGLQFVNEKSTGLHFVNVNWGADEDMRFIVSQGSGLFGVALYKHINKLVFENIDFSNYPVVINQRIGSKYRRVSFQINNGKLTMSVNDKVVMQDVSATKPVVNTNKKQDDLRVTNFNWLWADGFGQQFAIKKGFQLTIGGKFSTTNTGVVGNMKIFNWDNNNKILKFQPPADWAGKYMMTDRMSFNVLSGINDKRKIQMQQQEKISKAAVDFVKHLTEKISQNNQGDERIRQQIINDLNSMTGVTYYQDVAKRRVTQYYQHRSFYSHDIPDKVDQFGKKDGLHGKTYDAWQAVESSSRQYLSSYYGNILVLSAAHGGLRGQYSHKHDDTSVWDSKHQQWRSLQGYVGVGEHRLEVGQAHLAAINAASGDELIQMRNRVRALRDGRRTAAQYVGSDAVSFRKNQGIYVAGGNINNQVDTALNVTR